MGRRIFITGGTGYMGSRLIPLLTAQGHEVVALVRPGSERKLPPACTPVLSEALAGASDEQHLAGCDTFIQLVRCGAPEPCEGQGVRRDRSALGDRGHPRGEALRRGTFYVCERCTSGSRDARLHRCTLCLRGGIRGERAQRHCPAAVVRTGSGTSLALCPDPVLLARGKDSIHSRRRAEARAGDGGTDAAGAGGGDGASGFRVIEVPAIRAA